MPRVTSITQRQLTATSSALFGLTFRVAFGGTDGSVSAIVVQPDRKILIGGGFSNLARSIARLNANGSLDQLVTTSSFPGASGGVRATALQPDGKILIGGAFTSYNNVTQNRITRLNADGSRDTGFNIGSGASAGGGNGTFIEAIAVQPDGKILIGGDFTVFNGVAQGYLVRLNANGSRDTEFVGGPSGPVKQLIVQPDGKILVGGGFSTYNGVTQRCIARLNADGTLDTEFATGTLFDSTVIALALQPDGKILVGGFFTEYNNVTQNRIARLNADGTLDTGFNIGSGAGVANGTRVAAIAVQSDGKILIGGDFTVFNGVTQNRIARLNADGTLDTGFNIGTGFDDSVNAIAIQPGGRILLGGQFTTFNGTTQNYIMGLLPLPAVTYSQSASANNTNEASALTITIDTTNVSDGTVLRWRILDQPDDFVVNTGTVTITANSGAFSVTPTADQSTEGLETFRVQVEKLAGTVILTTDNITINDTSINPEP